MDEKTIKLNGTIYKIPDYLFRALGITREGYEEWKKSGDGLVKWREIFHSTPFPFNKEDSELEEKGE